jgi:lactate dehydrogenase-like 2-hydroxyacid dehydrogenase
MKTIRTRTISVRLSRTDFLLMSDVLQRRAARVAGVRVHVEPWIAAIAAMLVGYWFARALNLDTLLARSDHVVLVLPYSAQTHHTVGARELALMKPGATLVNIARGGIVDDAALAGALRMPF